MDFSNPEFFDKQYICLGHDKGLKKYLPRISYDISNWERRSLTDTLRTTY